MKCLNCGNNIPDASTKCPYCNVPVQPVNKVMPVYNTNISNIPNTPSVPVLPKNQNMLNQINQNNLNQNQAQNIDPMINKNVINPGVLNTNIPLQNNNQMQASSPQIPNAPKANTANVEVFNIPTPPPSFNQTTALDPTKIDLSNVDLNSNRPINNTTDGAKIGSTAVIQKKKSKKKLIILIIVLVILLICAILAFIYYNMEYKKGSERISATINSLTKNFTTLKNDEIEHGTGEYKLDINITSKDSKFISNIDGKYGYDLPNKKIDLINNINSLETNDGKLIDKALNTEIYLEDDRIYLLLQNFTNQYIYTKIDEIEDTTSIIKNNFNNPDEILLFKIISFAYNNNFSLITDNYSNIINNISQNDIDYTKLISGVKSALIASLNSSGYKTSVQANNIITIDMSDSNKSKMFEAFINSLEKNKNAYPELVKLMGAEDEERLTKILNKYVDKTKFKSSKNKLVIQTDKFKKTFKSIKLPIIYKDVEYVFNISSSGSNYKIKALKDNNAILDLQINKSTSKTSTNKTENKEYKGTIYVNDIAYQYDIKLTLIKDIAPKDIKVITRESIDYKYLNDEQKNQITNKISEFSKLGELFKNNYKGINLQEENNQEQDNNLVVQSE